jgi:hypothetical protein
MVEEYVPPEIEEVGSPEPLVFITVVAGPIAVAYAAVLILAAAVYDAVAIANYGAVADVLAHVVFATETEVI